MKTRRMFAAFAILAALGVVVAGCGQSTEQVEASSCSASADGATVTCQSKDGGMECAVTCSGAEGKSEHVVMCEGHDGTSECTVTCMGADGEKTCTVTCEGADGEKTCTITCDGKTATCEHAGGTCPGMVKTAESGGTCAAKAAGNCPMSAAAKPTEGATK